MGVNDTEGSFLELTTRPIKFGPASTANAVFYDEGRREILSVDTNGTITGRATLFLKYQMSVLK